MVGLPESLKVAFVNSKLYLNYMDFNNVNTFNHRVVSVFSDHLVWGFVLEKSR
jgi:hypothetical protein